MGINTKGIILSANSKEVGCFQSVGDIDLSRDTKEYECLNNGDIELAVGNIKAGDIPVGVKYDPADSAGAGEMELSFKDGTAIPFTVELSNKGTTNGTTFAWTGAVVTNWKVSPEQNGFVLATFTIKLNGEPTITAAA
ncbi:MAG: hypothetical protein QM497_04920 [Sulfurimonas sp.]